MESRIEKTVTLKLSEQEAKWLKLLLVLSRKEVFICCSAKIRNEKVKIFLGDSSSRNLLFIEPDGKDIVDNFLHALQEIEIPISEGA